MDSTYYETEFVNRRKEQVTVMENGRILCIVPPGESRFVESFDLKLTSYAKWYRIIFKDKGVVHLEENRAWRWPWPGQLMLELLNEDGSITEGFYIDDKRWDCYPKIPRYVPVNIGSPWAFFERVRYCQQEERVKDGDYFKVIKKLAWIKELRSKREIKDIERALVAAAVEKAKRETEARFPAESSGE